MSTTNYQVLNPSWQTPAFTCTEYFPKLHPYCVCIPVINEGGRIQQQLQKMRDLANHVDIIIADGGSTDQSLTKEVLNANNVRTLLIKTGPGKLSAQMRMAIAYALQQGYFGVIFIDGNNKDDPSAIINFIAALDQGYDHIQGSRYIEGGKAINTPTLRHLALKLIHAPLISWASGYHYTDTTNGFRAYSTKFLLDSQVLPLRDIFQEYELHYYLAVRAARLGFKITEIPVTRIYPKETKAPTKISPIKGNLKILKALFKTCLGVYNPK